MTKFWSELPPAAAVTGVPPTLVPVGCRPRERSVHSAGARRACGADAECARSRRASRRTVPHAGPGANASNLQPPSASQTGERHSSIGQLRPARHGGPEDGVQGQRRGPPPPGSLAATSATSMADPTETADLTETADPLPTTGPTEAAGATTAAYGSCLGCLGRSLRGSGPRRARLGAPSRDVAIPYRRQPAYARSRRRPWAAGGLAAVPVIGCGARTPRPPGLPFAASRQDRPGYPHRDERVGDGTGANHRARAARACRHPPDDHERLGGCPLLAAGDR